METNVHQPTIVSAVVSASLILVATHEDALLLPLPLLLVLLKLPLLVLLLVLLLLVHQLLLLLKLLLSPTLATRLLRLPTTKLREPAWALARRVPPKCLENCNALPVPVLLRAVTTVWSPLGEKANAATPLGPEEAAAAAAAATVAASRKRPAVVLVFLGRRDMFLFSGRGVVGGVLGSWAPPASGAVGLASNIVVWRRERCNSKR